MFLAHRARVVPVVFTSWVEVERSVTAGVMRLRLFHLSIHNDDENYSERTSTRALNDGFHLHPLPKAFCILNYILNIKFSFVLVGLYDSINLIFSVINNDISPHGLLLRAAWAPRMNELN